MQKLNREITKEGIWNSRQPFSAHTEGNRQFIAQGITKRLYKLMWKVSFQLNIC